MPTESADARSGRFIYFSPTGTTASYGRALMKGLGLAPVREDNLTRPAAREAFDPELPEDFVLIGLPVYAEHIPDFIAGCLGRMRGHGQPALAYCVYGNMGYGLALRDLHALCEGAGLRVVAMASLVGEHSFSGGRVRLAPGRPDAADLAAAEDFGRKLAGRLCGASPASRGGEGPEIPALTADAIPGGLELMAKILPKDSARIFARVPVTNSSCTKCGACAAFCPMGAIGGDLGIDASKCIRCFACAKRCGRGGRNVGFKAEPFVVGVTRLKGGARRENLYLS